jgi:hypothetical protein
MLCGLDAVAVTTVAPLFVVNFAPKSEMERTLRMAAELQRRRSARQALDCGIDPFRPAYLRLLARRCSVSLSRSWLGTSACLPAETKWSLRRLANLIEREFGRFLLAWAALNFAVVPFFTYYTYYPLMMNSAFDIPPATIALVYALATTVGVGLFVAAGRAAQQFGSRFVFLLGLALRGTGVAGALGYGGADRESAARKRQRWGGIQRGKAAADRENKAGI